MVNTFIKGYDLSRKKIALFATSGGSGIGKSAEELKTWVDGKRIYIAGDTDATKDAKAVKCDIALVPIGGTYTMDAKKAAELKVLSILLKKFLFSPIKYC